MRASNSSIQTFKSCRRLYELKYVYGVESVETSAALERGLSYHEGIERLLKGGTDIQAIENPKINAMVKAFEKYVLPKIATVSEVEKWFEYQTASGHKVVGRVDGVNTDGAVVEHKSVGSLIDGAYLMRLDFDEQICTYMLAFNTDKVFYTVCATPTIRQKKNETDDEFYQRCLMWYEENTADKIGVIELRRTAEQLESFKSEQDAVITEMENCKLFYRNPSHCTKWGRLCEYAPICMDYDPNKEYVQFKRREGYEKT